MLKITLDKKSSQFNPFVLHVGKVRRGAFAAGRKITRIISFSKKKPPRPGDPRTSYSDPRQGESHYVARFMSTTLQTCNFPVFPHCRLPVSAGESDVAGAVVLCVPGLSSFLP